MATGSTPLQPLAGDFKDTIALALAQEEAVRGFAGAAVVAGVRSVFLVGCGGSLAGMYPAHYLLETKAPFPVFHMNSDEFCRRRPALLGEGSVVVVSSHSGNTKETVAAARIAREARARVAAITRSADCPLAMAADTAYTYDSDTTVPAPRQVLMGQLAHALLEAAGAEGDYTGLRTAYEALPDALYAALEESEGTNHAIATALADEDITYVLSAGPNYGAGYAFAMCYLMEMQWKHAASFHAGEFFHGAFEILTQDQPVLLLLGEDASRPIAERARAFLDAHTRKVHHIDTAALNLPGVPTHLRGEISPIALAVVTSRLARHFEAVRGHDLAQRRYMFQGDY
ncbi:SIS domain-containing protein [Streptomyces sp. NPDC001928]|uniref:SIS domain-containing protein n=1 Tax=Streptomyces sp. NPDC001928 TaxID=3154404 RepID=UPI003316AD19